jgi:hypothetical protein
MEIDQQLEQRINVKFLVKLGKSGPEICQMLQQMPSKGALFSNGCSVIEKVEKIPRQRKVRAPFHFTQQCKHRSSAFSPAQ